ncbi:hypothetical protein AB0L34_27640 [Micromonospora sp. NPDC052213]|uniref:hypothetical protein n=1 Tax=Micromonospora sp. NPDC052213 TaxID=3155812 RepID=UPI0034283403
MDTIIGVLRRLTGWPAPPRPAPPGPLIEEREQRAAKNRLLDLAEQRRAAHLYDGPTR